MTELPALRADDPRYIPTAERERETVLAHLDEQIRSSAGNQPAELIDALASLYREVALRHTSAAWWGSMTSRHVASVIQRELTPADKARLTAIASKRQ